MQRNRVMYNEKVGNPSCARTVRDGINASSDFKSLYSFSHREETDRYAIDLVLRSLEYHLDLVRSHELRDVHWLEESRALSIVSYTRIVAYHSVRCYLHGRGRGSLPTRLLCFHSTTPLLDIVYTDRNNLAVILLSWSVVNEWKVVICYLM